eukprot:783413_1
MAAREPNNEVLRNVLTIIFSVLAGIAVCAGIAGILYALGVIVVHMGECKDKAGTGSDTSTVDPTPATVIQPAPATVYRHPKVKKEASGRIYVMFAKVKKAADGVDRYQNYDFTVIQNGTADDAVKTSGLTDSDIAIFDESKTNIMYFLSTCDYYAVDSDHFEPSASIILWDLQDNFLFSVFRHFGGKPQIQPQICGGNGNHHEMYVCIVLSQATDGAKYKFTYQPFEDGKLVAGKLSEVSGEVVAAATETNPFQQIVAGGKSSFITTIAAAAASGFMTAIILVAVMNFFKKKEPAKERLVAKYDATVV